MGWRELLDSMGDGARTARSYVSPWQYLSATDVASMAPGGGLVNAWQDSGRGWQNLKAGNWGQAAIDYGNMGLNLAGELTPFAKMAMAWAPAARRVYHYTDAPTDFAVREFKTPRGAVYTSLTPEGAEIGGKAAHGERAVEGRAPRVMPLVSDAPVAGLDPPPVVKWPESLTDEATINALDAQIRAWNDPKLSSAQNEYARDMMWQVWERGYKPSGDRIPDAALEKSLNPGVDWKSLEGSRAHVGPNDLSGAEKAEALRSLGFAGTRVIDDAPGTVAYFDPSVLRGQFEKPPGIRAFHGSPHDFDRFD